MSFNPIVAKLLSTENLTVMQSNVKTACFNVKTRVLQIPILLPKYEEAYGMLTAHEVGHALFTTQEFNNKYCSVSRTMAQYYNVCEDVRVEKLIKRKYPGLRRVMARGYEVFNANNYFLPTNQRVNDLTLIDRINAYFKIGHMCGVYFTPEERLLAEEVENAESVEDTMLIAEKIFAFVKAQMKKKPEQPNKPKEKKKAKDEDSISVESEESEEASSSDGEDSDGEDEGDSDEGDSDGESEEDSKEESEKNPNTEGDPNTEGASSGSDEGTDSDMTDDEIEQKMQSLTQDAMDGGLKNAVDNVTEVKNLTLETNFAADPIYSYKTILTNLADDKDFHYSNIGTHLSNGTMNFDKFIGATNRVVAHMVKEFEMKKCAHKQRRAQVSKTGQLNVNKLFAYKIKDELFKSITVTADDKNHGMIFLVDWSGSMSDHLKDTLAQVMSLAMFCRKSKIPFSVLAFTDSVHNIDVKNYARPKLGLLRSSHIATTVENTILSGAGYDIQLLELMSDKMNEREFMRMLKLLFCGVVDRVYSLNGTPLQESLVYMHSYVAKYKKLNNIEKLTFVVLTDGESDSVSFKDSRSTTHIGYSGALHKIIDPLTRKTYDVTSKTTTQTLLNMIKDSAQCQVIGFYLCRTRDLYGAISRNGGADTLCNATDIARSDFKKVGYSVLKNCGYDKLYLVNATDLGNEDYVPRYGEQMNAASLAREMTRQNSTAVSNKILMGRVIGEFSVGISA